jgi:hypothetical protein
MLAQWKQGPRNIKMDAHAIYLAARHAFFGTQKACDCGCGLRPSTIDRIPDFVPAIGQSE